MMCVHGRKKTHAGGPREEGGLAGWAVRCAGLSLARLAWCRLGPGHCVVSSAGLGLLWAATVGQKKILIGPNTKMGL